ncbi:MAG: hypothetical protein AAFN51_04530, partial [Pseudomonadota bacterium]
LVVAIQTDLIPIISPKSSKVKFSVNGEIEINGFDAERSYQSATVLGALQAINDGTAQAAIYAVIVEHTAVASQLFFSDGCGSGQLNHDQRFLAPDGELHIANFTIPYLIGFTPQLGEPVIGRDLDPIELGYAATNTKSDVREAANVYVLWSDPTGNYLSVVQHSGKKNYVKYENSAREIWEGGTDNPYCFDADIRGKLGLSNTFSEEKIFQTGDTYKLE